MSAFDQRGDAAERKREVADDTWEEAAKSALFACAECGTLASTNSGKHYAHDQEIDNEKYEGIAHRDTSARMTPPCPCGCDVFNFVFVQQHDLK